MLGFGAIGEYALGQVSVPLSEIHLMITAAMIELVGQSVTIRYLQPPTTRGPLFIPATGTQGTYWKGDTTP